MAWDLGQVTLADRADYESDLFTHDLYNLYTFHLCVFTGLLFFTYLKYLIKVSIVLFFGRKERKFLTAVKTP